MKTERGHKQIVQRVRAGHNVVKTGWKPLTLEERLRRFPKLALLSTKIPKHLKP